MAIFIDQKQEVLQLEMTPYGKHLFSKGEFLPRYYSFYDGDILYDGGYGGISESQNDIVIRIKDTPRLSVQTNYTSSISNANATTNISADEFETLTHSSLEYLRPIGTGDKWSNHAPVWNIRNISGSAGFSGSATYQNSEAIPTISGSLVTSYIYRDIRHEDGPSTREYDLTTQDVLRIDLQELNTVFKSDGNFDIEVFRQPLRGGEPLGDLQRLKFINPTENGAENLYAQEELEVFASTLARGENQIDSDYPMLDNRYVEFFLSVKVDNEIGDDRFVPVTPSPYVPGTSAELLEDCADSTGTGGG